MATFVYAPAIRVHIESSGHGIIDVSGDIANWTLTRRSNTVSSFNFVLQNAQRKYDGMFRPADRITVALKRITWVNVFTGSLNNSPVFSVWPRALPLSASCSLKKLQFWPWDPTTQAATQLVQEFFANNQGIEGTSAVGDGGLSRLVTEALVQVSNWDRKAIHFGAVPNQWFKWAQSTATAIDRASSMAAVLGAGATISGQQVGSLIKIPANGNYAGITLNSEQSKNAAAIYSVVLGRREFNTQALQDKAAAIAIMTAMTESSLFNIAGGDRDSVGLFQQRPSEGWGTVAECMDITHATTSFLNHLVKVAGWKTMSLPLAAQKVQRSAYSDGSNYARFLDFANVLVRSALRPAYNSQIQKSQSTGTTSTSGANAGLPTGAGQTVSTGTNFASVASDLITSRPAGSIRYQMGGDDGPKTTSPTVLDCSSLVEWVYYHTTGKLFNARIVNQQVHKCTMIPLEVAKYVQGALLFIGGEGWAPEGWGHVGISLGDGKNHVAAHDAYSDVKLDVNISPMGGQFTNAGIIKTLDYTHAATTTAAAEALSKILGKPCTVTAQKVGGATDPSVTTEGTGTNTNSAFQQLITAISNPPVVSGDIYGGARNLIHNTALLPWIKNVTNSSMRSFCSAPNGDFIAWFPDYFNVWGTAAVMNIQPIELQDFTVDWSDQQIVTHEFVIGSIAAILDNTSGGIISNNDSTYGADTQMLATNGIATMDFPQIFQAIYGKPASGKFVTDYLTRFGARPNLDQMANIQHGQQEFFMALWNFMYYWSAQFSANVPMTFMPELYPGMILRIPAFDFQAYVTEVEHSGSYGQSGGFTTKATIIAPARTSSKTDLFGMLPLAGK